MQDTKLFETIHVCALGEAAAWLDADANRVRGEFVLLVDPAPATDGASGADAARTLEILLRELPLKQAVQLAAELGAGKRNELYRLALDMRSRAT